MLTSRANRNFFGVLGLALLLGATGCGNSKPEQLGVINAKLSADDSQTSKTVVAASAPSNGQANVAVTETATYVHKRTFHADQDYTVKSGLTAEYVSRLNGWLLIDGDGAMYRFGAGSVNGTQTQRQTIDIGAQSQPLAANDGVGVAGVTTAGAGDGQTRSLTVTWRHTHAERYDDLSYTTTSTEHAQFVNLQNAYMIWLQGSLYRIGQNGNVENLPAKPTVNIGISPNTLSANDQPAGNDPVVSANPAHLRNLTVTRDFIHEETYQRLHYSVQSTVYATYVAEQQAYMAYVDNQLYRVSLNGDVRLLQSKPTADEGRSDTQIDNTDVLDSVELIPTGITSDGHSIIVTVRKNFRREEKFQNVVYHVERDQIAEYDPNYRDWTLRANGHLYVITFPGDNVTDPDVVVVHAPSNFNRPQVLVVPGQNGAPPAVIPAAPGRAGNGSGSNNPPVVIPPPPSRSNTQSVTPGNGGPAVVIPKRPLQ
jgi:hypothetical protein